MAYLRGGKASEEEQRLAKLVREQEQAKKTGKRDKFGLPPVEKGWVRGMAYNIVQSEAPGEFGTELTMDFDLREKRMEPGIPIRMTGIYFNTRMMEGAVMDVPDPTPAIRPITPDEIFFAHHGRTYPLTAHYPGRRMMTQRRGLMLGMGALLGPVAALGVVIAILHWVAKIF